MRHILLWFIAAAISLAGAFAMGFALGTPGEPTHLLPTGEAAEEWRDRDALEVSPAVRDAVARWKAKAGDDMRHRDIQTIQLTDRVCIKLAFEDLSIGGEPVYCYKTVMDGWQIRETTELVYDGSDVE